MPWITNEEPTSIVAFRRRLAALVVLGTLGFGSACDCRETTNTVTGVTPPVGCLQFEPTEGNECELGPVLRGRNDCPDVLTFENRAGQDVHDVMVQPRTTFDYKSQVHLEGRPPSASFQATVGTTPIVITVQRSGASADL